MSDSVEKTTAVKKMTRSEMLALRRAKAEKRLKILVIIFPVCMLAFFISALFSKRLFTAVSLIIAGTCGFLMMINMREVFYYKGETPGDLDSYPEDDDESAEDESTEDESTDDESADDESADDESTDREDAVVGKEKNCNQNNIDKNK